LLGASVKIASTDRPDVLLFNETQGRIVISVKPCHVVSVEAALAQSGIPFQQLGTVTQQPVLGITTGDSTYQWSVTELNNHFESAIPSLMEG